MATLLQAALRGTSEASLDAVKVTYDGTQFVITLPQGADGTAVEVTAAFTGANAAALGPWAWIRWTSPPEWTV